MDTIGDRIRLARRAKGLTQQAIADHFGIARVSVTNWEGGGGPERDRVPSLAQLLGTSTEWLLEGKGSPPQGAPASAGRRRDATLLPAPNARLGPAIDMPAGPVLPVYGQAVGGPDGRFSFNGNKIDDVLAPPMLRGVRDAYAVYVAGSSMEPRYRPGETAYVHPHLPVRQGDFVIVQIRGEAEEDPAGYVKEFVSWDDRRLRLRQFNPRKTVEFPSKIVISVHRIVLAG